MVVIMNNNYNFYYSTIIRLIANFPDFQKKAENSCPTMWANGEICPYVHDVSNKAFLEVERLDYLDLI